MKPYSEEFQFFKPNKLIYVFSYKVCASITCFYYILLNLEYRILLPRRFCMHALKPLASSAGTQEMSICYKFNL